MKIPARGVQLCSCVEGCTVSPAVSGGCGCALRPESIRLVDSNNHAVVWPDVPGPGLVVGSGHVLAMLVLGHALGGAGEVDRQAEFI